MKVTDYIKNALYDHDCVIVPGFGGFLVEQKSATINPITHMLVPPSTSLAFNASLTKDDGLLKSEICIGEGIAFGKADVKIKRFVDELNSELSKEANVTLKGLGSFTLNNSNLLFSPDTKANYNIDGFGLDSFVSSPINQHFVNMTEENKQIESTQETVAAEASPIDKNAPKNKKSGGLKWLFILLPALFVFSGGGFVSYKVYKNEMDLNSITSIFSAKSDKNTSEANLLGSADTNSVSDASSIDEELNTAIVTETSTEDWGASVETIPATPTNTKSTKVSSADASKPYHIIGGVFSSSKKANKFADQHQGCTVLEIGGAYKVSVASFNNKQEAISAISSLTKTFGSDIWVFKN